MALDPTKVATPTPRTGPESAEPSGSEPRVVGRYLLFREIASGGMASVHIGRLLGPVGFSRTVAIKRLHPQFERDPQFVAMFLDEARIAARIRHPNVVPTLDVVADSGELLLVMDYVEGESLARLLYSTSRSGGAAPPYRIVLSIMCGVLQGLHAAHEAKDESGQLLGVVHRDVSPQNVLVGVDGTARVLDFGIAKAMGRLQITRAGELKGKFSYMAPEQIRSGVVNRRCDIYSASVVLWEALTGSRLFVGEEGAILGEILDGKAVAPSVVEPSVPPAIDRIVMKGMSTDPSQRFPTALEMARELSRCADVASPVEVAEWVARTVGTVIAERAAIVAAIESARATPASASLSMLQDAAASVELDWPRASLSPSSARERGSNRTSKTTPGAPWWSSTLLAGSASGAVLATALVIVAIAVGSQSRANGAGPAAPEAASLASGKQPSGPSTAGAAPPPAACAAPQHWDAASARPLASSQPSGAATTSSRRPPAATPPRCNPPYYYDEHGLKVYKPGCV